MPLESEQRFITEKKKTSQGLNKGIFWSNKSNNFLIILMKRVISNKNIYVLCLPEHEIHANLLPICVQKSVITSGTLHNLTGHVGITAQDNKIVFWIKPHVFFVIL